VNSGIGRRYLNKVAYVHEIGLVPFKGFRNPLPTSVSLIYLLQPQVIQYIHTQRRLKQHKKQDEKLIKAESLCVKASTL
jgi:hypothetical protein